jgi:hypothetical protein
MDAIFHHFEFEVDGGATSERVGQKKMIVIKTPTIHANDQFGRNNSTLRDKRVDPPLYISTATFLISLNQHDDSYIELEVLG